MVKNNLKKNKSLVFLLAFALLFICSPLVMSAPGDTSLYIYPADVTDITQNSVYIDQVVINWDTDYPDLKISMQIKEEGGSWTTLSSTTEWVDLVSYYYEDKSIGGLDADTNYEVRAVITEYKDTGGNGYSILEYSNSVSFSTLSSYEAPSINTNSVSGIGATEATFNGQVTDMGTEDEVEVFFEYRTSGGSWINTLDNGEYSETLSSTSSFSYTKTGLSSNTGYEVEAFGYVSSEDDYISGGGYSFMTDEEDLTAPTISVNSASSIGTDSATLSGNIDSLGDYSEVYAFFSVTNTDTGTSFSTLGETLSSTGEYTKSITGLDSDTNYEYSAYITYGEDGSAESGTSSFSTSVLDWTETSKSTITSGQTFSESITGLDPDTEYKYQAGIERNGTTYWGDEVTFTTSAITQPTLTTNEATSITSSSATLNGEVTDMGSYSELDLRFGVLESGSYFFPSGSYTTISSTGTHSYNVTGLNPDTNYEYSLAYYDEESLEWLVPSGSAKTFTTTTETGDSPTLTDNINNVTLIYEDERTIYLNDYFTGFNNISVSFLDFELIEEEGVTLINPELEIGLQKSTNNYYLNLNSFNSIGNITLTANAKNQYGTTSESFNVEIVSEELTEEEAGFLYPVVDWFNNIFPDSDDLTSGEKFAYVFITMFVISVVMIAIGTTTGGISKGILILTGILNALIFFFYISIGYISLWILITLVLIASLVGYFKLRGGE